MGVNRYLGGVITANQNPPTIESASGTWTLEEAYQNIGNWPMAQTQIANSLRFNSADSAYLSRTPTVAGSSSKYTVSMWIKLGKIQNAMLFGAGSSTADQTYIRLYSGGNQAILWETDTSSTANWYVQTNALLRDPSAWYHLVFAYDSSLSGVSNQAKIYINGVQASVSTGGSGTNSYVNTTVPHYIGRSATTTYFDGYMTEFYLIDGLALDADYFGFFDANGIWQPRQYKGSYGTNGFYLPMSVTEDAPTWYYNPMATFNTYNRGGSFSNTSASIYLTGAGYDGGYMGGTASPGSFPALQNNWNLDFILNRDCVNSSPFPNYTISIGRSSSATDYYNGNGNTIATVVASNNYNFNWYVYNGNGTQLYTGGGGSSSYAYAGVAVRISFNASTYTFTFYGNTSGSFTGMTQLGTYTLSAGEKSAMQSSYGNSNFYIGSAYRANNDGWRDIRWYTTA